MRVFRDRGSLWSFVFATVAAVGALVLLFFDSTTGWDDP